MGLKTVVGRVREKPTQDMARMHASAESGMKSRACKTPEVKMQCETLELELKRARNMFLSPNFETLILYVLKSNFIFFFLAFLYFL